ncbi:MAG: isoprenylcysteine carboxylmethyltransferase family protein [Syntrophobacterales bacterium]|jgi:protein-S-isoprenylcysteine O-methyltransferase Ste14|nr:isoprenylcysteine carboxylmethyltransferase family protein [Syntrophobacterales bacterium]
MALQEQFEKTGEYFFRWRSYLPLFMAGLFILALVEQRSQVPPRWALAWDLGCLGISLLGLALRFFTVGFVPRGTSGRNTRGQVADVLNTTGLYACVRNPIYLGNFIIWFGLSLVVKSWWFTTLIGLFFTVFYERIICAEERFLREKFGEVFLAWAEQTPVMIPNFRNWRAPSLPFSWKSAINREYATFFAIIASYTVVELLAGSLSQGKLTLDKAWIIIFLAGGCIYLTIRYLKKKTKVLATDNR